MADITSTLFLAIRARNEVDAGLNAASLSLRSFAAGAAGIGLGGLALGAGMAGVAAVKMAGDFQQSMLKVQTMTGTAASAMPQLTKGVLDMAKQVPFSAQSLAESMYFISSSGFKGADAMHILHESAMEAANGGLKDASGVANVLTTALASYGLHADQAGRVTGILQNAVALGKAEMDDFARSLSTVLPAAATSGVQFEQVANAMALLTLHGETAQKSAQGLNRILAETIKPTAGEQDAARRMGLTDVFTAGNLAKVGFPDFMSEIAAKVPKGPEGQTLLAQLFGDRNALRDARIMLSDLDTLHKNMATFNGDVMTGKNVSDGFATTMKGFNQSFEQAKDSIGASATELGLTLLPAMTSLMNTLGPSVAGGIDAFTTGLGGLMAMAGQASGTLAPLRTALTGALSGLGAFLQTTVLPTVKMALGTMLLWWQEHGATITKQLGQLAGNVQQFLGFLGTTIGASMTIVGGIWKVGWGLFSGVTAGALDVVTGNWKQFGHDLQRTLQTTANGMVDIMQGGVEMMIRVLFGLAPHWNDAMHQLREATKPFSDFFVSIADNIQFTMLNAFTGLMGQVDRFMNFLHEHTKGLPGGGIGYDKSHDLAPNAQVQAFARAEIHARDTEFFRVGYDKDTDLTFKKSADAAIADLRARGKQIKDEFARNNGLAASDDPLNSVFAPFAGGTGSNKAQKAADDAIASLLKKMDALKKAKLDLTMPAGGPPLTTPPGLPDTGDGTGAGGGGGGLGDSKTTLRQAVRDARAVFQTDLLTKGVGQEQLLGDVGGIKTAMVTAMQQAGLFTQPQIAKEVGSDLHRVTTMFAHMDMRKLEAQLTLSRDHLQDLLKQGDKASADRERQHFITLDTQKYMAQGLPADLAKQLAAAEGKKIGTGQLVLRGGLKPFASGGPLAGYSTPQQAGFGSAGIVSFGSLQATGNAERLRQAERQIAALTQQNAALVQEKAKDDRQIALLQQIAGDGAGTREHAQRLASSVDRPRQSAASLLRPAGVLLLGH